MHAYCTIIPLAFLLAAAAVQAQQPDSIAPGQDDFCRHIGLARSGLNLGMVDNAVTRTLVSAVRDSVIGVAAVDRSLSCMAWIALSNCRKSLIRDHGLQNPCPAAGAPGPAGGAASTTCADRVRTMSYVSSIACAYLRDDAGFATAQREAQSSPNAASTAAAVCELVTSEFTWDKCRTQECQCVSSHDDGLCAEFSCPEPAGCDEAVESDPDSYKLLPVECEFSLRVMRRSKNGAPYDWSGTSFTLEGVGPIPFQNVCTAPSQWPYGDGKPGGTMSSAVEGSVRWHGLAPSGSRGKGFTAYAHVDGLPREELVSAGVTPDSKLFGKWNNMYCGAAYIYHAGGRFWAQIDVKCSTNVYSTGKTCSVDSDPATGCRDVLKDRCDISACEV